MSQGRLNLIAQVFDHMDKTKDQLITLEDIEGVYEVKDHPKFQSGEMTKKQVLEEFINNFEPDPKYRDASVRL